MPRFNGRLEQPEGNLVAPDPRIEAQHVIGKRRELNNEFHANPSPFRFRSLGTMASLGHTRAVALVLGVRPTGFLAWMRRTYYLFQMPRWDRRLRIVLDWTVALFFRPAITRVDLRVEREQVGAVPRIEERAGRMHLS